MPQALYGYVPDPANRAGVEATTRTGMIAGLAGLAALGSLALTTRTYRLAQQGQLTDRYTKAVEQLGDDKLDIRLGGIYALERIAVDSTRDHPTIVEVLSAYVREHTAPVQRMRPATQPSYGGEVAARAGAASRRRRPRTAHPPISPQHVKLGSDVQAALTVLGRLPGRPGVTRADLSGANLTGAWLEGANLTGALLLGANLTGAALIEANLTEAQLGMANLTEANLRLANLTGAWLGGANLTKTRLGGANLGGASLGGAEGLTHQQLDVTLGNSRTTLPTGLRQPASWS
ncbi:pentapeptide repeat-containing protein [Pseudonocardia sp.]|uniref:pentapeptide repeat-containing protein n=1 Tax=Pseudonocardia sp. TaxID=60912 RepID=UPI003D0C9367